MFRKKGFYWNGEGVEKYYATAQRWFLKAGDAGEASGYNNLGNDYRDGNGVAQDYNKAYQYYLKAANMGNATSMNQVGLCYWFGRGVAKNVTTANKWYLKAGEAGESWGYKNLADNYRDGNGVTKSFTKAQEYYEKAVELGNSDAATALDNLIVGEGNKYIGDWEYYTGHAFITISIHWYSNIDETDEDNWLYGEIYGGARTPFMDGEVVVGQIRNGVLELSNSDGYDLTCRIVNGKLQITGLYGGNDRSKTTFTKS